MADKSNQAHRTIEAPSFEVQILAAGTWTTELVLADRDEAEAEAERLLASERRPLGVCVLQEMVDAQSGLITATTIFRRTREDEHRAAEREEKLHQTKAKIAEIRAGRRAERAQSARQDALSAADARAPRRRPYWLWFLILLAGLLIMLQPTLFS